MRAGAGALRISRIEPLLSLDNRSPRQGRSRFHVAPLGNRLPPAGDSDAADVVVAANAIDAVVSTQRHRREGSRPRRLSAGAFGRHC